LLPNHFYHSTVAQEASLFDDKSELSKGIASSIVNSYNENVMHNYSERDKWVLNNDLVEVSRITVVTDETTLLLFPSERIRFAVGASVRNTQTGETSVVDAVWNMKLAEVVAVAVRDKGRDFFLN
jgi:hypothetical protein